VLIEEHRGVNELNTENDTSYIVTMRWIPGRKQPAVLGGAIRPPQFQLEACLDG
jgi:hypothetical protein